MMHLVYAKSVMAWAAFAVVWPLFWAVQRRRGLAVDTPGRRRSITALLVVSVLVLTSEIGQALLYTSHALFFDVYESSVAAVSSLLATGRPVYPAPDAPAWYVQIGYGPMLYVLNVPFIALFGPSVAVCKWAGVLSFLGTLALTVDTYAARGGVNGLYTGLVGAAALALSLGRLPHLEYWTRADPHIVFCVALALWCCETRRLPVALRALAVGCALGVAVNLKLTACIYFLPIVVLALRSFTRPSLGLAAVATLGAALLPFAARLISFANYRHWLGVLRAQGVDWHELGPNVWRGSYWLLPLLLGGLAVRAVPLLRGGAAELAPLPRAERARWVATFGAAALLMVVASKPGATIHHLLPLCPLLLHAFLTLPADARSTLAYRVSGAAFVTSSLVAQAPSKLREWHDDLRAASLAPPIDAELREFVRLHPKSTIEMGPTHSDLPDASTLRPFLVQTGNPYPLDVGTLMDSQSVGGYDAGRVANYLRSCAADFILFPARSEPFADAGYYSWGPLFPPVCRTAFRSAYQHVVHLRYYDAYACVPS